MQFGQQKEKRERYNLFFQAGILNQKKLTALNKNKIYHHIMTVNESNYYK